MSHWSLPVFVEMYLRLLDENSGDMSLSAVVGILRAMHKLDRDLNVRADHLDRILTITHPHVPLLEALKCLWQAGELDFNLKQVAMDCVSAVSKRSSCRGSMAWIRAFYELFPEERDDSSAFPVAKSLFAMGFPGPSSIDAIQEGLSQHGVSPIPLDG